MFSFARSVFLSRDFSRNRSLCLQSIFRKHYSQREMPAAHGGAETRTESRRGGPCQSAICENSGVGNAWK